MKKEQYEKLANELLSRMENAQGDWKVPFANCVQVNAMSKKPYRGFNQIITSVSGYGDPRWIGFKQCQDLGGAVLKGSEATIITRWIPKAEDKEESEESKKNKGATVTHAVFNVAQTNLIQEGKLPEFVVPKRQIDTLATKQVIETLNITLKETMASRAYYSPIGDFIHLPLHSLFNGQGDYDSTFAHELGHWTGHESRMARKFGERKTNAYAIEELIAETFALLYCREYGIDYARDEEYHVVDNSVLYIKHWLQQLKEDPIHVLNACRQAYDAFEWVTRTHRHKNITGATGNP
jgi:putative DNA primase/helicase